MAATYEIDTAGRLVLVHLTGDVSGAELIGTLRALWADPQHDAAFDRIIDAWDASSLDVQAPDVQRIAREWASRMQGRTAVVVRSGHAYGLARMYELYADDPNCEVFSDRRHAREWLLGRLRS